MPEKVKTDNPEGLFAKALDATAYREAYECLADGHVWRFEKAVDYPTCSGATFRQKARSWAQRRGKVVRTKFFNKDAPDESVIMWMCDPTLAQKMASRALRDYYGLTKGDGSDSDVDELEYIDEADEQADHIQ